LFTPDLETCTAARAAHQAQTVALSRRAGAGEAGTKRIRGKGQGRAGLHWRVARLGNADQERGETIWQPHELCVAHGNPFVVCRQVSRCRLCRHESIDKLHPPRKKETVLSPGRRHRRPESVEQLLRAYSSRSFITISEISVISGKVCFGFGFA